MPSGVEADSGESGDQWRVTVVEGDTQRDDVRQEVPSDLDCRRVPWSSPHQSSSPYESAREDLVPASVGIVVTRQWG